LCLCMKEDLGEGLHLIDFEQLKIENQTYNEKIEERNEVPAVCITVQRFCRLIIRTDYFSTAALILRSLCHHVHVCGYVYGWVFGCVLC